MRIDVWPAVMPDGLNEAVTPEGSPETLSAASWVKPLELASWTDMATVWPTIRLAVAGAAEIVNVPAGVTLNGDAVVAVAPALATVIGPVDAPVGMTTPTEVAETLWSGRATGEPFCPGILTCGEELKLLPVIVTTVPEAPDCGAKPVIVTTGGPMTMEKVAVALIPRVVSVTVTAKPVKVPLCVGVPLRLPAALSANPAGSPVAPQL